MSDLRRVLKESPVLLADGAMGTMLLKSGMDSRDLPTLVLDAPESVMALHIEYLKAGARLLTTHSFSANQSKLTQLGVSADVYVLNRRAAQLARHARDTFGESAFIWGSLGPLAQPVNSPVVAGLGSEEAESIYREAVAGLLAGGVDGFIVETMSDLPTVYAAVRAIRSESGLPVAVTFAFSPEGTTLYGLSPEMAARAMAELPDGPPDLVGANCGSGPSPLLDAVIRMAPIAKQAQMGLGAFPNAGQPQRMDGQVHYPATPGYMATITPALQAAGCTVVGGCCGTTPEHIRAIAATFSQPPVVFRGTLSYPEDPVATKVETGDVDAPGRLSDLFPQKFVVSVELDPPRGVNPHRLLQAAKRMADVGADAINVGDSPMARVRLSALATTRLIAESVPVQTILHFTTRDRNLMGLQSDLLGAHSLGIRNVLCLTGDPPSLGDYAHATAVYDLDSSGLARVLAGFNRGVDALGQSLGSPTEFNIGVGVNPNATSMSKEIERFRKKLDAGAMFVMTQPLYSADQILRFMDQVGPVSVPMMLGVMPLVSYRQALYLHNEVPGIVIPDHMLKTMEKYQDGIGPGVAMMVEFMQEVHHLVNGVYLVPSFNKVEPLIPLIDEIRRLTAR